ncbi:hypothetical protein [Bradyrhizobium diazoefficiens]
MSKLDGAPEPGAIALSSPRFHRNRSRCRAACPPNLSFNLSVRICQTKTALKDDTLKISSIRRIRDT